MRHSACVPDVITINTAICACDRGGAWHQVLAVMRTLRRERLAPDVISFSGAVGASSRGGRVAAGAGAARRHAERRPGSGRDPLHRRGQRLQEGRVWPQAAALLGEMRRSRTPPSAITFNAAVNCLAE
eukprot:15926160-Heterocapsa_arctica.AAC.1